MNNYTDKEKLARWMLRHSFATGHGDTIDDLLKELDWQIEELRAASVTSDKLVELVLRLMPPVDGETEEERINAAFERTLGVIQRARAFVGFIKAK
jgi:hypothetical protein